MKRFSGNFAYLIIEPTDLYFNEVHGKWFPVPKHWVGDFVSSHSYSIKSGNN
jgi:hypothetical protein